MGMKNAARSRRRIERRFALLIARTRREGLTRSRPLFEGASSGGQLFPKDFLSAPRAGSCRPRTDFYYLARINSSAVKDAIDHPFSVSSHPDGSTLLGLTLPPSPEVEGTFHRIAASRATGSFPIQAMLTGTARRHEMETPNSGRSPRSLPIRWS
jgi:hypothetical protein